MTPHVLGDCILHVAGLSVMYGPNIILRDVTFQIRDIHRPGFTQGQKVALLAPSGMGKTQLFKRIAGLEAPSLGGVRVGKDMLPTKAGMVGMVPQNYLLFEHRTVKQSLMIAARMREADKNKAEQKVAELMLAFGLINYNDRYPSQLSGGQRQRVSIAEQLLSSNHFLLMDEPFSGLDIVSKKVVCDTIDSVAGRDELNTILFSTHDIESAVMVADTIMLLGRERDAQGQPIPGARIMHQINLIERGLAWQPEVDRLPAFASTVAEVKALFKTL